MTDDDKTPTPPRRAPAAPAPAVAAPSASKPTQAADPVGLLTCLYHECSSHGVGMLRMKIAEVIGALGGKAP